MSSEPPPTLETPECEKLLDALLTHATTAKKHRKAVRNHCMALLMLDAGLRVGELMSLRLSDLYFNREPVRTIFIKPNMTKNKVAHSIPVSGRLAKALTSFFRHWHFLDPDIAEQFAFCRADSDKAITTRQVERIICAAGWKALGRPVNPHLLRHTFASKLMRVTNSSTVQQILGHRYLSSTQVYCHPNEEDKRQAIEAASAQPLPSQPPDQQQQHQNLPVSLSNPGPQPASPSGSQRPSHW